MKVANYRNLSRRKVRYWCFRFKTEVGSRKVSPGATANGAPRGLRAFFEKHEYFTGWEHFNETAGWDVGIKDPFTIVPLKQGSADAWEQIVEKEAKELPIQLDDFSIAEIDKDGS